MYLAVTHFLVSWKDFDNSAPDFKCLVHTLFMFTNLRGSYKSLGRLWHMKWASRAPTVRLTSGVSHTSTVSRGHRQYDSLKAPLTHRQNPEGTDSAPHSRRLWHIERPGGHRQCTSLHEYQQHPRKLPKCTPIWASHTHTLGVCVAGTGSVCALCFQVFFLQISTC